jgi:lipid-binding SYLF domain-containing protein
MNIITRRALMVSGVGLATGALLSRAEAATGSVILRIASAGFIVGVTGGSGSLSFEGRQYPLTIGGISAGALIGASATDLVGVARHLRQPGDIAGVYSAVGAGLSIAGGRSTARLTNANGVVLQLHGRQVGFSFSIDLSGMTISLA